MKNIKHAGSNPNTNLLHFPDPLLSRQYAAAATVILRQRRAREAVPQWRVMRRRAQGGGARDRWRSGAVTTRSGEGCGRRRLVRQADAARSDAVPVPTVPVLLRVQPGPRRRASTLRGPRDAGTRPVRDDGEDATERGDGSGIT